MVEAVPNADVHVVVFDVNVWMDVAELVGPGNFSWTVLTDLVAKADGVPVPARDARLDSARALATCMDGNFAGHGHSQLQVWTSGHIDDTLLFKLAQRYRPDRDAEDSGFGWTREHAEDFLHECVYDLVWDRSHGNTVGEAATPAGDPPLTHEDGRVYRTALEAGEDPVIRYCVTRDRDFRLARDLPGDVTMLYPFEWVQLIRRTRLTLSFNLIRPNLN